MAGLTLQQIQQMGGTPVNPTPMQPTTAQGLTLAQIKQMGGTPYVPPAQPDLGGRVAEDLQNRGTQAERIINDPNEGTNAQKALKATGTAFGAIGDVAKETIDSIPGAKTIEKVGGDLYGKFASLFATSPEQEASANKIINDWANKHPEASKNLTNSLGAISAAGDIANNILPFETVPKTGIKPSEVTSTIKETANTVADTIKTGINDVTASLPKLNPTAEETISSRVTGLQKVSDKYVSATNAVEAAKAKGFDPIADIASDDRFIPSVDTDGTIDAGMAIKKLNDFVKPLAQVERQAIEAEGKSVSFDKFSSDVRNSISKLKERGSSYDTISNKIESDLKVYKEHFVTDGKIDLTKLDDIKNTKYTISNWNNEDAQIADKSVARAARQTIIDNVSNADIQKLNAEMSRYYSARDFLDAIDGKKVAGGRLGKYFARVIGGTVGSHFGVLGGLIGGITGDRIESSLLRNSIDPMFGKKGNITPTSKTLETTKATLEKPKLQLPSSTP